VTNSFRYTGREFDTETGLYYYRARYYDPEMGRFLSEDPIRFGAGHDFYRYVYNDPIGLTDAMGLSPSDVQRIQAKCKKCTKALTDAGLRMEGGSGDTTVGLVGATIVGWINDLRSGFSTLKKQSCYSQAVMTQPCLEDPTTPYDDPSWEFNVIPIWFGSHRVVSAGNLNSADPIVICDPWLNRTYTVPKPPSGGGSAF
jgi:RHS repeat-associated protein